MRGEAGRVGDRKPGSPNSPFHCTRDIPVTREPHPATLSVPNYQALHRRQRRRAGGTRWLPLLAGHC